MRSFIIICIHFCLPFLFLTNVLFIFTFWPFEANQSNQIVEDHVEKPSEMAADVVDGTMMEDAAVDAAEVEAYRYALVPVRGDGRQA